MAAWLVDRVLPGVISGLILAVATWASHVKTRRHITRVTEQQTRALKGDGEDRT